MWPNWVQVYFYSWSARMVLVFESLLTLPYHHVDVDDYLGDIDDDSDHADGAWHTCKKRVMLRSRLFWPKKICGKSA